MLISLLTYLLISNALTMRKDKSILFSRITMTSLILTSFLALNNLSVTSLDKGIGIYGGLFHVTPFTQSFNIFIFIITAIIFALISFYPKKIFIKGFSTISKLLYKFACNKISFLIMEYSLIVVFIISGVVLLINTDIIIFTINIICLLSDYFCALINTICRFIDLICGITLLVIITFKVIKLIMLCINILVKIMLYNIHLLLKSFIRFILVWSALNIFLELAVKYSTCSLTSNLAELLLNHMDIVIIVLIVGSNILRLKQWKSIPYLVVKKNPNLTHISFMFSGIGCAYFFTNFVLTPEAVMDILDMVLPNFLYIGSPVGGSTPGGGIHNSGGGNTPNNGGGGNNVGLPNHNPDNRTRSSSSSSSASTTSSLYSDTVRPNDTQHIRDRKLGNFIYESYFYVTKKNPSFRSFENSDFNPVTWGITSSELPKRISREVEERLIHEANTRLDEISKGKAIPNPYSFTLKDIGITHKHPLFGNIKGILFPHLSHKAENEVIYSCSLGVGALKALRNAK